MKRILLIVALLIALPSAASASDKSDNSKWTWEDSGFQVVYSGLLITDWTQTLHVARNDSPSSCIDKDGVITCYVPFHEQNSLLGEQPSKKRINTYFATNLILHAAISYLLPKPYRTLWQGVWIGIEYDVVSNNRKTGIGISLHF